MNKSEFKVKFKRFYDTFGDFLDAYEKNNPEWMNIAFSQILYNSIISLKALIESQKEKEINWNSPYAELRYPIEANWEKLTPVFMTATDKDLEDIERTSSLFAEGFLRIRDTFIFRALTKEILTIIKGDKYFYRLTVELDKKLNKLSEKERKNEVDKLIKSITKSIEINFIAESFRDGKEEEKRIKGSVFIQFNPCVINADEKKAYYPIVMGIGVKGHKPASWDKKTRELLWRGLLQGVKNAFPKEVLDFKLEPLPEPTVKPISKETALIKVGLHVEQQKFRPGKEEEDRQLALFKERNLAYSFDVIGLDLTIPQSRALLAVQRLLDETGYKGNVDGIEKDGYDESKFRGYVPRLKITTAQYLEAYGVDKVKTGRDKLEYSGKERMLALEALEQIAIKQYKFYYERQYWIKTAKGREEKRIDLIITVSPLIKMYIWYKGLTEAEAEEVKSGRLTQAGDKKLHSILIEPAPILIDQINKYFLLKPFSLYQDIKRLKDGRYSVYIPRFIEWLMKQEEMKRRKRDHNINIKIRYKELARTLRMDSWIKSRHWTEIKKKLLECYQIAKELGYISGFKIEAGKYYKGVDEFILNLDKFPHLKEEIDKKGKEDKKPQQVKRSTTKLRKVYH